MKHSPHCNSLYSYCSPLLLQLSASLVWDILMTTHVMQNVLSNSGKLRLQRYLKNADNMGWVLIWWRYMTQQLLSVQKHLSFTLQWLHWLQVHVFTWRTITPIYSSTTNKMQHYTMVFITINALHVSGGSSAHQQELKTIPSIGYLLRFFCFLPLSWVSCSNYTNINMYLPGKKHSSLEKGSTE